MIKTKQSGIKTATQSNFLNYVTNSEVASSLRQRAENEGGFFGGVGYLFEKLAVGFMTSVEGIWDYAAGGIADLFGADKWAESQMENDWFGDWYSHPEEWYNPSSGWQTAGDVAGGIGTSAPSMLAVAGAAAIAYYSGGSLSSVSAGLISAAVAGLGAAGTATKEAYRETGKLGAEEYGYGAMVGVTEGAIEGVTSVIGAGSGKIVKSIANSFGKQAAKSVGKTTLLAVVLDLGKAFISEAFEEGFATWIDPYYKRATYDPDAENATAQEILYTATVGGIAGMIMDGGAKVTNTGISYLKGRNIANKGNAKEVMKLSEYLSAFENQNKTEDETYTYIAETYAKLAKSLASTGGEIKTAGQKKLLGDLQRANTVAVFKPMVYKSAANIVSNADIVAERINSYYKDANGNPLNVTAADIVKGIDKSSPQAMSKSFQKALQENGILRTLAVADTTGHLFLDAERFEQRMMQSNIASQADLNRFIETASEEKKASLGEALGIENWDAIELEEFNEKFQAFVSNGDIETFKAKNALIEEFKSLQSKEPKRGIPKNIHSLKDGETRTFNDGYSHIAIKRAGDGFTIYDYGTGNISHELSLKDANKALRTYAFKRDETVAHNDKVDAERNKITEVNKYATENIKGYSALSDANKGEIRRLIRQGRAKGINDNDILMYARVATRTGVRISFDKEALAVAKDKDTQELIYADGVYDGKNNVIIVNPEATRTVEALLIHELTHAIDKTADGKIILMKGVENMSDEEKQAIVKRYTKAGHGGTIELIDEINAHYAEGQLANRKTLEKLLEKEPSIKDKILSFFKKASADTEDERLSKKAKAFYKTYKKMFDLFADRNYQSNSFESSAANGIIGNERFTIEKSTDNKPFVVVDEDILDGVAESDWIKEVKSNLATKFPNGVQVGKNVISIDNQSRKELTFSKYTNWLKNNDPQAYSDKLRATNNADEVLGATEGWINEGLNHPRKDNITSFARGTVLLRIGKNDYSASVIVGTFKNGKMILYDIINLTPTTIVKKETANAIPVNSSQRTERKTLTISNDSITETEPNVNTNDKKSYAMPKTDQEYLAAVEKGDIETAQKMVDEAAKRAGYTIKSYHGTLAKDFTEFKKSFIGSRFNYDDKGFFFIDRKSIAEDYASSEFDSSKKGRVLDVYLRVKKPLLVDKQFCLREGLGNPFRDEDAIGVWDAYLEFFKEEAEVRKADGIILDDGMSKMTVVFDGEQIKSADPVTYDDAGKIIPLSRRFSQYNRDIRFALPNKDSQGNELTAEQQEFFKDSKIRAVEREVGVEISPEGSLLPVYHGTNSGEFYEFDKKLTGSSNDAGWYGRGFYFAFNKGEAEYYGRRVIECYLNIKNPFFFSEEMQSYDGVESGDVFFDFGSFIINFAKKFPKLAAQESITITKEFDGQGNGDSFEKSIVDFAAELEELYKSERLKLNEVHSDEGKYYEYKFKNNVDEIVKDEELKKLIRENWIDTPYMANVAYKNGEITFEQSNAIMDLMDEYGYENFRDARIHGARFKTKESAEKNRLSACVSYLSNHRYAYIEQHMPEHYIQRISKQFTEELKAQGYDGIVQSKYGDEIVAFEENQIKLTSNKKPTVNKDMRFALPYTAPTTDAVTTEVEQAYKPTIKDKVFTGWTATQIAFTNAQAGIEKVGKILGVSDIESIVQAARSATNQADEMLAGNQRRIGDKSKVYQGEGLEKILRPVKEKGTEYTEVFFDYLFNYHNVNRMNFEAISIARNNGKVKLLAKNKKDITNLKKRKSALIKSRSTAKNASARKSIQTQIKDIDSQINAIEKVNKKLENDIASFVPAENKPVLDCTAKESATYIKEYEKNYPEFKGIARKLWNFIENLNQYRVDTGLISQDTMMYLKQIYPHYVPTYRTDTNQGIGAVVGKYNLEVKKAIKRAKGSTKDLLPIDVMLARQVEETIRAGRINVIANALYEGAQSSGKSTYIEVISKEKVSESEQANIDPMDLRPKNNQVTFFRDGEKITMRVSSEVFAGFDAFAPRVDISNPLLKIANKVNDTFKRLVTSLNPAFLLRNSARDIQDAGIYSKYPKSFLKNYARAAKYITEDHDLWQLYRSMGGLNSSVFDFDKGIVGAQNKWGLTKAEGNLLTKLLVNVENANAFVEQLPRFAEFISSIEAGNTTEQAILDSADVTTNFGRSGTLTKKLNSTLIPFLNPAIQGFSKLIRTITGARTAKEITALLLKIAVVGIIPHLINDLMYDDDEDYEQLRDTDKENNFLFKIGDKFIKIPKGRVASIFAGLVNRTKDMFEGESDAWDGYVDNVIQQVTPVSNFSRTIFSPFMDVSNNLTWYGSAIEGQQFENTAPKDRYDESTSSIAVWLGQLLNYSPKKIHYILDQYSGVIGDFILPATTQKAEKDFISGNFTLDPVSSNKLSTDFYNIYEEAQYAKTAGDDTAIYQVKYLNKVKSAVSEMYKQKSKIQKSDLTDEEKLVQTNAIQILINEAFKTAVSDYKSWTDTVQKTQGVGADLSSSERVTLRYTESLRIMYGSERALREYDAKVYENCQLLSKANISYDDLYYFYFSTRNITSDKDKQGNTIAGSKRNKIMSAVNQLKLPAEQKLILIASKGYSLTDDEKDAVARYIVKLKQISKDDKIALAEMCGLEVKGGKIVTKKPVKPLKLRLN